MIQNIKLPGVGQFYRFKCLLHNKYVLLNLSWISYIEESPESVEIGLISGDRFEMSKNEYDDLIKTGLIWG